MDVFLYFQSQPSGLASNRLWVANDTIIKTIVVLIHFIICSVKERWGDMMDKMVNQVILDEEPYYLSLLVFSGYWGSLKQWILHDIQEFSDLPVLLHIQPVFLVFFLIIKYVIWHVILPRKVIFK